MACDEQTNQDIIETVKKKYAGLALGKPDDPGFLYGAALAKHLGYETSLEAIPEAAVESFAGVGNPVRLAAPQPGERILDIGSGAGLDSLIAARRVGESGYVVGVDMTPEMVDKARTAAAQSGLENVEFLLAQAEELPFEDGYFDAMITNGVMNLTPHKEALVREAHRVLASGGRAAICDVVLAQERLPKIAADPEAWAR